MRLNNDMERKLAKRQQTLLRAKALLQQYKIVKEVCDLQKDLKKLEERNARARVALETWRDVSNIDDYVKVEPSPNPGKCFISWDRPQVIPD